MTGPNANLKLSHKRSQLMTDQHNRIIQTIQLDTRKFPSPRYIVLMHIWVLRYSPDAYTLYDHENYMYLVVFMGS